MPQIFNYIVLFMHLINRHSFFFFFEYTVIVYKKSGMVCQSLNVDPNVPPVIYHLFI